MQTDNRISPLSSANLEYVFSHEDATMELSTKNYDIVCLLRGTLDIVEDDNTIELSARRIHVIRRGRCNLMMRVDSSHSFEALIISLDRDDLFCRVEPLNRADELFERAMLHGVSERESNEELASLCCLSVSTFKRRFRDRYSVSPHRWFISLKLDIAERLLRVASIPLRDVAEMCGFVNISHFISTFRRRFRVTPSRMRRSMHVAQQNCKAD